MRINLKEHKLAIAVVAVVLFATCGIGYYLLTRGNVSTDDAFVDGYIYTITPRVSGYVTTVQVYDNERVKKGQILLTLDPTSYKVAVAQAKANLAESKFTLTSLELGVPLQLSQTTEQVRGAEAQLNSLHKTLEQLREDEDSAARDVQRLQAQVHLAKLDLERNTFLRKNGAVSQQTLDNSTTTYQADVAQLQGAEAKFRSVKKQRAAQEADIQLRQSNIALAATGKEQAKIKARQTEAQRAKVKLAEAQLKQAELNLSYATIVAPTDGYVTNKTIRPGQYISPGQQLFAVVPLHPPNIWITANYKETSLTDVRPGQSVDIEVDTYSGITIKGTVNSIMSGTGAVFSLFPPQNATGNYVKVVQRIPVKITINQSQDDPLPILRIGMSVEPTIFTRGHNNGKPRDKQMVDHSRSDAANSH
jgi:membrane fusion protein, multidrug efflux system